MNINKKDTKLAVSSNKNHVKTGENQKPKYVKNLNSLLSTKAYSICTLKDEVVLVSFFLDLPLGPSVQSSQSQKHAVLEQVVHALLFLVFFH